MVSRQIAKEKPKMTSQMAMNNQSKKLTMGEWVRLGANAAVVSIVAVLLVQILVIYLWPAIALFAPLDSFLRSTLFTLVPAVVATALLAWLAGRRARPVGDFVKISAVVLVISFIPDYILPVPHKTVLASTVAAFLHVVAAVAIVWVLAAGYRGVVNRLDS